MELQCDSSCAKNPGANNVLTDFLHRPLTTAALPQDNVPSMNIRLQQLGACCSISSPATTSSSLGFNETAQRKPGSTVPADMLEKLHELFWAGFCDDSAKTAIGKVEGRPTPLRHAHGGRTGRGAAVQTSKLEHNAVVVLSCSHINSPPPCSGHRQRRKGRGRRVRRDGAAPQGHGRARAEEILPTYAPVRCVPRRDRPRRDARLHVLGKAAAEKSDKGE